MHAGKNSTLARKSVLTMIGTLNLMTTVMTIMLDKEGPPPPFQAVWNYPDKACRNSGIDFELTRYGIDSNKKEFIEDTIALYYSALIGKWPYFEFGNITDKAIHGGFPHQTDLSKHLAHISNVISTHQSPYSSGFGVIDMELWRPLFNTNYGRYTPYKEKMVEMVATDLPDKDLGHHRVIASKIWNLSTKNLMLLSLTMAKMARPETRWGYYGYPERTTAGDNHQLAWLWGLVTAYYPSIYIKDFSLPLDVVEEGIKASIAESFRVRALYGNPDDPIMVYTDVQSIPEGDQQEDWIRLAIQVPIEMGVDGIILWASSNHFIPDIIPKCRGIQQYVKTKIGPFIDNLFKHMTLCSKQLCNGRGRCVKKSYAKSIPFLQTRGVPKKSHGKRLDMFPYVKIGLDFKRGFMCQCYKGSHGRRCSQEYPHD